MVAPVKILIAGMGNSLRRDDGFGVAVAAALDAADPPVGVDVLDAGIGGIHLVQELHRGYDVLIVVDALEQGREPGTLLVLRPDVLDVDAMSHERRRDQLADMHYATPEKAMMLARALGVLPTEHWLLGCEPLDAHQLGIGLSGPVAQAVPAAVAEIRRIVTEAGIEWAAEAARTK